MKMNSTIVRVAVVAGMFAWAVNAATIYTYFTFPALDFHGSGGNYNLGSEFRIGSAPITVTSVGTWASAGTLGQPLGSNTTIHFYLPNGTVIANGFIPAGTVSDAGGFSYAAITPFVLDADTTYIVTAFGNNFDNSNAGGLFGPDITYLSNRVHFPSGVDAFPETVNGNTGFWGATFKYSIPEPASLSLLAFGGLALLRRRR